MISSAELVPKHPLKNETKSNFISLTSINTNRYEYEESKDAMTKYYNRDGKVKYYNSKLIEQLADNITH